MTVEQWLRIGNAILLIGFFVYAYRLARQRIVRTETDGARNHAPSDIPSPRR
jgi:hypothetical protein